MLNIGKNNFKYQQFKLDFNSPGPFFNFTGIPNYTQQFQNTVQKTKFNINSGKTFAERAGVDGSQAGVDVSQAGDSKKPHTRFRDFVANNAGIIDSADKLTGTVTSMIGGKDMHAGPKGNLVAGIEQGWDSVADIASNFGPWGKMAGGIMKVAGMANKIQNAALGNKALDNMTTTDAILSSPLGQLVPGLGLINALAGQNANTITKNEEAFAKVGSANGGAMAAVDDALNFSGKRYGAFSSGARKDANFGIDLARSYQNQVESQALESTTRKDLVASMSAINSNRRSFEMQGGWNPSAIHFGREGMVLQEKDSIVSELQLPSTVTELKLSVEEFKEGGTLTELKIEKVSVLNELGISKFKEGGTVEKEDEYSSVLQYVYDRFPILKILNNIELYHDKDFQPSTIGDYGNIEYIQSKYDNIPYYDNYTKPENLKGKSVIVYNNAIIPEDIALDMISHGLREYDPKYLELIDDLLDNDDFYETVFNEGFPQFSKMEYKDYQKLSDKQKKSLLRKFEKSEEFTRAVDGLIRALLVKDELSEKLRYNYSKKFIDNLKNTEEWKNLENYIFNNQVDSFKEGGSFNVIPEGALHARLHHMEDDENITKKGIPVVSEDENGNIEQQAEVERGEIIFRLEVTKKLEELLKKYSNDDYTQKEKDEFAIEAGKLLTDEILNNTIDNTNSLI